MTRYSKGYRPSPPDERDWSLTRLGVTRLGALPDRVSYEQHVEAIYDQFGSSCVGWGLGRGWHVRARIQGDSAAPFPSAPAIYSLARSAEDPTAPLVDGGAYPRLGLYAISKLGVLPLERWNDPGQLNDRPDWEALRESADCRGIQYARLFGIDDIRRALAAGHPVAVGYQVDQSFVDYAGGTWDGMLGPAKGGHCTCLIGYEPGRLRGVNSWSYDWGESGLYWISDAAADGIEAWAVELVSS